MQKCDSFWKTLAQRIAELKTKWTNEYTETEKTRVNYSECRKQKKKATTLKEASDVQMMIEVQKLNKYTEKHVKDFETSAKTCKIEIQLQEDINHIVKNIEEKSS